MYPVFFAIIGAVKKSPGGAQNTPGAVVDLGGQTTWLLYPQQDASARTAGVIIVSTRALFAPGVVTRTAKSRARFRDAPHKSALAPEHASVTEVTHDSSPKSDTRRAASVDAQWPMPLFRSASNAAAPFRCSARVGVADTARNTTKLAPCVSLFRGTTMLKRQRADRPSRASFVERCSRQKRLARNCAASNAALSGLSSIPPTRKSASPSHVTVAARPSIGRLARFEKAHRLPALPGASTSSSPTRTVGRTSLRGRSWRFNATGGSVAFADSTSSLRFITSPRNAGAVPTNRKTSSPFARTITRWRIVGSSERTNCGRISDQTAILDGARGAMAAD